MEFLKAVSQWATINQCTMTSGLALADLLHTTTGHTIRMDYIGVDIAPPMLERAERFEEVRFFAEGSNFYYYRNWNDIPIELLKTMASRQTPIILNASYLFASRSLDGEDLAQFVIELRRYFDHVYFVFQNPNYHERNTKFNYFKSLLRVETIKAGVETIIYKPASRETDETVLYEIFKLR